MNDSKQIVINISHCSNERTYSKKNLEKYFVFSYTIEYLIFQQKLTGLSDCSLTALEKGIIKGSRGKIRDTEWIGRWISELFFMELIQPVDDKNIRFKLTKYGEELYRQQTFQFIYANLLQAKENRNLSIIAIGIAFSALIVNLFTIIFPRII